MYADNNKKDKTIVLLAPYFANKRNLPLFYQEIMDLIRINDEDNLPHYGATLALDFTRAEEGVIFTGRGIDNTALRKQVKDEIEEKSKLQYNGVNPLYAGGQCLASSLKETVYQPHARNVFGKYSQVIADGGVMTALLSSQGGAQNNTFSYNLTHHTGTFSISLQNALEFSGTAFISAKNVNAEEDKALDFFEGGKVISSFVLNDEEAICSKVEIENPFLALALFRGYPSEDEFTFLEIFTAARETASNSNDVLRHDKKALIAKGREITDRLRAEINEYLAAGKSLLDFKSEISQEISNFNLLNKKIKHFESILENASQAALPELHCALLKTLSVKADFERTYPCLGQFEEIIGKDAKKCINNDVIMHFLSLLDAKNEAYSSLKEFKKAASEQPGIKTDEYIQAAEKYIAAFAESGQAFLKVLQDPKFYRTATVETPLLASASHSKKMFILPLPAQEAQEQLRQFKLTTDLLTRGIRSKSDNALNTDPDVYYQKLETRINEHKATVKSEWSSKIIKGCLIAAAVVGIVLLAGLLMNPIGFSILAGTAAILLRDGEFNNIPIEAFAVLPYHK